MKRRNRRPNWPELGGQHSRQINEMANQLAPKRRQSLKAANKKKKRQVRKFIILSDSVALEVAPP